VFEPFYNGVQKTCFSGTKNVVGITLPVVVR